MDWLGFNSGNSGILESTWEYSGITWGSFGNDSGMTREYLGDSGKVQDMTQLVGISFDIVQETGHLHLIECGV